MNASHLLTAKLRVKLLSNGREPDGDWAPVVKFFNPVGAATWLASGLGSDGDTLFGIADLGFGCPEMGSFSLAELESIELPFGLRIERDIAFSTDQSLSIWADAARAAASLIEAERVFLAAHRGQRTTRRGGP